MTGPEERQLRSLVGQILWCSRCLTPELSFAVSELSGKLAAPRVEHLIKANVLVRRLKSLIGKELTFRADLDVPTASVVVWSDASFGTMDNDKSQYGHLIGLTDASVETAAPHQLVSGSPID